MSTRRETVSRSIRSRSRKRVTLFKYLEEQIGWLKKIGKYGTARNYMRTKNSIFAFRRGKDTLLHEVDQNWVGEYDKWLKAKQLSRNTISFYMRVLRAVLNKAIKQFDYPQTCPFLHVYTGVDHTRKLAINEKIMMQLQKLDLSFSNSLSLTRDIFIFSFYTRGMAFVDIAFLQKSDINKQTISYARRKTGQFLVIRLEPCMERLIRKYEQATQGTPYVFPLIKSSDPRTAYIQYQTALGFFNRQLKRIARLIDPHLHLSSYTARHTWATLARDHNIPLSIISAGMGHTSENTTRIYLATLENSVIDKINLNILSFLEDK